MLLERIKRTNEIVAEAERNFKAKEQKLMELKAQIKQLELSIQEEEGKIKKWESQLRDVQKYREQLSLMAELAEARREKGKLEDEILKLMEEKDRLEREIQKAEADLRELKKVSEANIERWKNEALECLSEFKNLSEAKKEILKSLELAYPDVYKKYLEIASDSHLRKPISRVEDSTCSSCNVVIFPDVEARIYSDINSYEICPNCGAILYVYLDDEDSGA